ncbi:MAG: ATP-binding cassette domain-containing protein [Actinobacteria bacterium]|nr:MAG: ATP-binding cassette domain-containing protein [Actinomycetota bacterium]
MIEVVDLRKRYRKATAVDGLTFMVRDGCISGFLGPNGAGKTTTLRILLGLVHPTSGRATIDGHRYRALERPLGRVGAVLEASNYHPKRSGRNHLRALAAAGEIQPARIDELLDFVGLGRAGRRAVGGYSLGMRQRLSVAGALLGDPQILLLDEPANGLDPEGIRWLRDFLRGFAGEGKTVFISSHVLGEMQQLVDEVVIIHHGRLVAHETVGELTARAAGGTRLRSPQAARLREALEREGIDARGEGDRLVTAAPSERVGEVAAANGIVLHELAADTASLEEAFLELTAGGGIE